MGWKGRKNKKIVVKKSIEVRVSLGRRGGIVLERHIEYRGGNLLKAHLKKECMESTNILEEGAREEWF